MKKRIIRSLILLAVMAAAAYVVPAWNPSLSFLILPLFAHCDTMDGPVVQAAQKALETGNVTPALIWVQKKDEEQVRKMFDRTLKVRKLGPDARETADMYFFETLVRLHRAGEGEPYTGIEPAGSEIDPAIQMADKAIATGSIDAVAAGIPSQAARGIRDRFQKLSDAKKHMNESVEAGRQYVAAYVDFIHYVEGIHDAATPKPAAGEGEHQH